ncbi:MAG: LCP family protein [Lachnospiraceae bacterium]|nr:LCP family protein [Lachnospiraceae bacterium]
MKDEIQSIFDEFETDEETGEVIIPRAPVGVVPDMENMDVVSAVMADAAQAAEEIAAAKESTVPEESTETEGTEAAEEETAEGESKASEEGEAAKETEAAEDGTAVEESAASGESIAAQESAVTEEGVAVVSDGELPVLSFDFNFEEELANIDTAQETEEDTILQNIDEALAAQMSASFGAVQEAQISKDEVPKKEAKKKNIWTRIPLWCRVIMISLCSLCLVCGLLIGTKPGRKVIFRLVAEYLDKRVTRPAEELTPPAQPTQAPDNPGPTQSVQNPNVTPQATVTPTVEPRHEEYCYNILLIGEEALEYFGGSRSDTMILISVNSKEKKIHMTSLMRDMYVQIPGYADDKLNAAYSRGGVSLLIDTIELNFQVKIDGYVKVGFDNFEWIVDRLGGVEITLTAEEAQYLRTTRYITNPAYRNVVAGTQLMNGNQVLGYCRVRYVPTANGTHSDFGRTERQRLVLTKIFNKYKESSIFSLLSILNDCLPMVTTDISKSDMQDLLETVVDNRILTMDTMRIPISGTYEDVYVGESQVLQVKLAKNIEALYEFIFGPEE